MRAVIFEQSGLCEKFDCTCEQLFELYDLWLKGFCYDSPDDEGGFAIYVDTLQEFESASFDDVFEMFDRDRLRSEETRLNVEVKKSAGTYDEWIEDIKRENKLFEPFLEKFFKLVDGLGKKNKAKFLN